MSIARAFIGRIYTSFSPPRQVEGLLIVNGVVVYAGDAKKVEKLCRELDCELHDVSQGVVLPGFIDAHVHLDSLGLLLNSLDLRDVRSVEELKRRLREYASKCRGWVIGRGWDHECFVEKRYPTRWDLDEAVPDKPVLITRVCGHVGVVNTRALEMLKLEERFHNSPNLIRDERGVPTGIVREEVLEYVSKSVEHSLEDLEKYILDAQEHALRHGVTTVGFVSVPLRLLPVLFKLKVEGKLKIRLRLYLEPEALDLLEALGVRGSFGDDMLRIQGVKIFMDGSLGARTAWLSAPYSDDPSTRGYATMSESELRATVERVRKLRLQLAVHAIGDRALDVVLKVFREVSEDVRRLRFRIEHVSVIRDDQLDILAGAGAVAVVQPHFVITDWWVVERVGVERARWVYRYRSMLVRGVKLAFSTDAPVEPINPWETIYAAVTRGVYENVELAKLTPDEKLDLRTALDLYTRGSAYAIGDSMLGSLEPGSYADMVIVDRDPFTLDNEKELTRLRTLATYVAGVRVY